MCKILSLIRWYWGLVHFCVAQGCLGAYILKYFSWKKFSCECSKCRVLPVSFVPVQSALPNHIGIMISHQLAQLLLNLIERVCDNNVGNLGVACIFFLTVLLVSFFLFLQKETTPDMMMGFTLPWKEQHSKWCLHWRCFDTVSLTDYRCHRALAQRAVNAHAV